MFSKFMCANSRVVHAVDTTKGRLTVESREDKVHTRDVRRRACSSSSEVPTRNARKRGQVQSLFLRRTRRRRRCIHRGCEEDGQRAIPLPPKYSRLSLMKPRDMWGGELVSPPPDVMMKNAQQS